MKGILYGGLLLAPIMLQGAPKPYLDLTAIGQEQYQDIVINGEVISHGARLCASRYEAILPILKKYRRPITVLDLGASQGYFSFMTAKQFPQATCIMVEGNYDSHWKIADQLEDLCHLNDSLDNIIFLKKKISPDDLKRLSECEHFDVVLAFNIIHHFGKNWKQVTDAIMSLGDNIIIECPPAEDTVFRDILPPLNAYLREKKGVVIAETPRHTSATFGKMFWFEKKKKSLQRVSWFHTLEKGKLKIESNYKSKSLYHVDKQTRTAWQQGINLTTFAALGGCFPKYDHISAIINGLPRSEHGDFTIWNLILQGKNIAMIDTHDERHVLDTELCHQALMQLITLLAQNNAHVEQYFSDYFQVILKATRQATLQPLLKVGKYLAH